VAYTRVTFTFTVLYFRNP